MCQVEPVCLAGQVNAILRLKPASEKSGLILSAFLNSLIAISIIIMRDRGRDRGRSFRACLGCLAALQHLQSVFSVRPD